MFAVLCSFRYFLSIFVDRRLTGEIDVYIIDFLRVFSWYSKFIDKVSDRIAIYSIYSFVGIGMCFKVVSV